jgi:SMC interacting uncharacterized protein involved in chromosome segregation
MTPQEKNVFSKLFPKTELGTHKVDLALTDDIKSEIQKYKGLKDNVDKAKNKAKDMLITYSDNIRVAYQNAQNAVDLINQLETKAKELGLGDTGFESYKKDLQGKAADYKKLFNSVDGIGKSL